MKPFTKLISIMAILAVPSCVYAFTLGETMTTTSIMGELSSTHAGSAGPYMDRARGAAGAMDARYQGYPTAGMPYGQPFDPRHGQPVPGYPMGHPSALMMPGFQPMVGHRPGMPTAAPPVPSRVTVRGDTVMDAPPGGFVPDQPGQWANQGFNQFRMGNYEAGIQLYRQARDADFKYSSAYDRVERWKSVIDNQGRDGLSNIQITDDPMPITVGMYFGWTHAGAVRAHVPHSWERW